MLNRKDNKPTNGADHHGRAGQRGAAAKGRHPRRRFIISSRAAGQPAHRPDQERNGGAKAHPAPPGNVPAKGQAQPARAPGLPIDLAETIKTLVNLARENGHLTYDDINDVLPDGLSPDDLDELYTKLRNLDIEITEQAEVERAKPAEPEEEEDARLEIGRAHV